MKKFAGRPAAATLARNVELPMKPCCRLLLVHPYDATVLGSGRPKQPNANGCGYRLARNPSSVEFIQLPPVYLEGSPACAAFTPFRYARKIGSGAVPGAPVYAKVLPSPAAMLAWRLACARRNSLTNPFSKISNSL